VAAAQDSKESRERVRDVGERAITAGALHLAEGSTIWDAYRSAKLSYNMTLNAIIVIEGNLG